MRAVVLRASGLASFGSFGIRFTPDSRDSCRTRFVAVARDAGHITDFEVQMIVGFVRPVAEGFYENVRRDCLGDAPVFFDALFIVEQGVADAENVRRPGPVVRTWLARKRVGRRAVAA